MVIYTICELVSCYFFVGLIEFLLFLVLFHQLATWWYGNNPKNQINSWLTLMLIRREATHGTVEKCFLRSLTLLLFHCVYHTLSFVGALQQKTTDYNSGWWHHMRCFPNFYSSTLQAKSYIISRDTNRVADNGDVEYTRPTFNDANNYMLH